MFLKNIDIILFFHGKTLHKNQNNNLYMDFKIFDGNLKPQKPARIDPDTRPIKLALWLFMGIITCIYVSLTIIYLSGKNFIIYHKSLPEIFKKNSLIIIISFTTIFWAYIAAKRNNLNELKIALAGTILLGLYFLQHQKAGWFEIIKKESLSEMKSTTAFFLIITSFHFLHIIGGLIFVFITLVKTFEYKVHSKNMIHMEISLIFWTFAILVWVLFLSIFS